MPLRLSSFCLLFGLLVLSGCVSTPPAPPVQAPAADASPWRAADWSALPGWGQDAQAEAWPALLASCRAMRQPDLVKAWSATCAAAIALGAQPANDAVRRFLETQLRPWQALNAEGGESGLITGYYEPLIRGSRTRSERFRWPVFGVPDDMITVELGGLYPELRSMRLRGRLEGRRLLPYWSREQIEALGEKLPAKVLLYTDDALALFFLQVQGSGQVELPDGMRVRIAYADQNGHPYKAIGRVLADRGEVPLAEVSMQRITAWGEANPARLPELLASNPSYVFFREEAATGSGPRGSLGVPLTAGRSVAIDPRRVPLGTPLFLATTTPDGAALERLVLAQDTGGAIRGPVRADFFFGFGSEAGALAGRMKQAGRIWLLWPRDAAPPGPLPVP